MATRKEVELTDEQADILESWTRTTTMPQGMVTRARIVLALADGETPMAVARAQRVAAKTVHKWRNRFLEAAPRGSPIRRVPVARA